MSSPPTSGACRDLTADDKPAYISVEAQRGWYLGLLFAVGYNAFKCVNQERHKESYTAGDNESLRGRLTMRARRFERRVRRKLALQGVCLFVNGPSRTGRRDLAPPQRHDLCLTHRAAHPLLDRRRTGDATAL